MRTVIWLILLFAAAVVAAAALGANDGLVSVYWGGWRADLSLNLFVLLVVGASFVIVTASRAFTSLATLPRRAREWRLLQRERAALRALREAQTEYFAGRWGRATKAAERAAQIAQGVEAWDAAQEVRLLAHLLAAGSAHRLQDRPGREAQLQLALALSSGASRSPQEGARLLAAEWALDDRDADAALHWLDALPAGAARRTQALRLRMQALRLARRPADALRTARLLVKHQGLSGDAAQGLLRALAGETLEQAHDADQLGRAWQALDAADRQDPRTAARAATRAAALGAAAQGRVWLLPAWERLAALYSDERTAVALALAECAAGAEPAWLERAEATLRTHARDGAVALAAGSLFADRSLWGKALRPLQMAADDAALEPRARRSAWRRLALIAREQGDDERAALCDRAAAQVG